MRRYQRDFRKRITSTVYPRVVHPKYLFGNSNDVGFCYLPSDLDRYYVGGSLVATPSMYQDSAGTIPVTAVGQPVGLIRCLVGKGPDLIQPSTTSRPVLSNRVNLLQSTDGNLVSSTGWSATRMAGTLQVDGSTLVSRTTLNQSSYIGQVFPVGVGPIGAVVTARIKVKKATSGNLYGIRLQGSYPDRADFVINLDTGVVTPILHIYYTGLTVVSSVLDVDGFFDVRVQATVVGTVLQQFIHGPASSVSISWEGGSAQPLNAYVKEPDVRVNTSLALPAYQRVTTATDYDSDTSKFPLGLQFDGVDDSLYSSSNLDMTSTDKVTVIAGVRKLSDTSFGMIVETGPTTDTTAGTFAVFSRNQPGYTFASFGSSRGFASVSSGYPSPESAVISGIGQVSTDTAVLYRNGVAISTGSADQGTGNYISYPIYVGRRNNTNLPFNGLIYGIVGVGKVVTDNLRKPVERFMGKLSGGGITMIEEQIQEDTFHWVYRTLIVPEFVVGRIRYLASQFGESSSNMWIAGLSTDGKYPVSHYISAGLIGSDFAEMLSSAQNLVYGASLKDIVLSIEEAQQILDICTISELNYQEVLSEMQLQIAVEEQLDNPN